MILSIFLCFILSLALVVIDRHRTKRPAIDLRRLAPTFASSAFMVLVFGVGFMAQAFLDAYVTGTIDEFVDELQNLPGWIMAGIFGNAFLLGVIPASAAAVFLHYSRSFFSGVVWGAIAATAALVVRFLIQFWDTPYGGSWSFSLFSALLGCALTCYFAQAIRGEIYNVTPSPERKPAKVFIVQLAAGAVALSVALSFGLYYLFIFNILKPLDLRYQSWGYVMVTGTTTTDKMTVGLFGRDFAYHPSIPFQGAYLEEDTLISPETGEFAAPPSRLQLHFARVLRQTSLVRTGSTDFVSGRGQPSFGRFRLTLQPFTGCTARDLAGLRQRMASGEGPMRVAVDTAGVLEMRSHRTWIFHPGASAPDLNIMLPAWDNDWIHLAPLEGRGVSIGSQSPLAGRARAMIESGDGVYLAITLPPSAMRHTRLGIAGRAQAPQPDSIYTCRGPVAQASVDTSIAWDRVTTDDRVLLSGYLLQAGPAEQTTVGHADDDYIVRLENPDRPTTIKERLVMPLAQGPAVDSLLAGVRGQVVGVSILGGSGRLEGTYGGRVIPAQDFGMTTISGENLRLRDDPARRGGLRLKGSARHVNLDDSRHYYTFANQVNETAALGIAAASLTGFSAIFVFLWRRIPRYRPIWAPSSAEELEQPSPRKKSAGREGRLSKKAALSRSPQGRPDLLDDNQN